MMYTFELICSKNFRDESIMTHMSLFNRYPLLAISFNRFDTDYAFLGTYVFIFEVVKHLPNAYTDMSKLSLNSDNSTIDETV